jgi:alpha-L-fucosidase
LTHYTLSIQYDEALVNAFLPPWAEARRRVVLAALLEGQTMGSDPGHPFAFGDGRDWFFSHRFGMFLHWGVYAVPAWHEQIQWRQGIPRREYEKYAEAFNPQRYDPDRWLDLAEAVGMDSVCFTAKHHDGFCLWDTDCTDFKVTKTPYGQDVLAMLAAACHRRGMPLRLYYSVVDWHHPCYPTHGSHHELPGPEPGDTPDREAYLAFVRAQVEELCTRYGELHGFWWDMNTMRHHDPAFVDESFNARIRELQPKAVINNRGFDDGDFGTPERECEDGDVEDEVRARRVEACQSVGTQSWGYREDEDRYSLAHLTAGIDRFLARGANYLLNVGPRADGTIDPADEALLRRIGGWYRRVGESFLAAAPRPGTVDVPGLLVTAEGSTLYLHLPARPMSEALLLPPLREAPERAVLLNDGRPLQAVAEVLPNRFKAGPLLRLRGLEPDRLPPEALVVRLEFAGELP